MLPDQPARRSILPDLGQIDFLPVFDAFDEGVIVTDTDGRILFYNETQAAIDDLRPGKVIGKRIADIYQLDWHDSMIFRCIEASAPIIGRLFFTGPAKGSWPTPFTASSRCTSTEQRWA
jgi:transcriptional regulator with PAS, ATPase and Fis domain